VLAGRRHHAGRRMLPALWLREALENVAAGAHRPHRGSQAQSGGVRFSCWLVVLHRRAQPHGSGLVGSRIMAPHPEKNSIRDGGWLGGPPEVQNDIVVHARIRVRDGRMMLASLAVFGRPDGLISSGRQARSENAAERWRADLPRFTGMLKRAAEGPRSYKS
jgi:hypothetical protein